MLIILQVTVTVTVTEAILISEIIIIIIIMNTKVYYSSRKFTGRDIRAEAAAAAAEY
jgi:hypothetical protein